MPFLRDAAEVEQEIAARAGTLLRDHQQGLYRWTDRLFACLMAIQWLAAIAAAFWITPRTWDALSSQTHPHVWSALFLGGAMSVFPIALALWQPGRPLTRHIIAIGQMLMSGLLIHLTGGRIETHFHVFGSLAFLAFYRDWPVLVTATVITASDHALRGILWPQSIFGAANVEPWRWVEHAGWVVFMDIFLIISATQSVREMRDIAWRRARQEAAETALAQARDRLEVRVQERTADLAEANTALEHDLTERRRVEEALRSSEQRYRGLIDYSPEAIVAYSDSRVVYVNAAALSLFGAACADELLGCLVLDLVHPDSRELARERARRSQEEGTASPLTRHRYLRLDGTAVDVEAVSTPIQWQGRPGGQVVIRDITERLEAERRILDLNALLEQRLDRIVILNHELAEAYDGTIEGWSRALDLRDHETEGHSLRVTEMTIALAKAFDMDEDELVHVRRGALLHDIGKMGVPDGILLKPGPLTEDERAVMQQHPVYAFEMLSQVPFVRPALDIPYFHHERWDGQGYPNGLRGEDIPLAARLFAVVDVWDALRSDRPYRKAWPVEKTRQHIAAAACTHFDPHVVEVFLRDVAPRTSVDVDATAELPRAA